jgi:acrylyl-CoA reductase (NADPH)
MALGTAGFTAALSVMALEEHGLQPGDGEVVVTGASGGVGSVAVALLAALGHTVVASTGRETLNDYLKGLGASEVIGRFETPARPMASGRWAGAVDGVGGDTLAALLAEMRDEASVAAYGLAGGHALSTTVFPFILRGVNLLGVNSVTCPLPRRKQAWERLASDLPAEALEAITTVAPLSDIEALAARIVDGDIRGRTVITVAE